MLYLGTTWFFFCAFLRLCLWRVESFKLGVCSRLAMPKQKPLDKWKTSCKSFPYIDSGIPYLRVTDGIHEEVPATRIQHGFRLYDYWVTANELVVGKLHIDHCIFKGWVGHDLIASVCLTLRTPYTNSGTSFTNCAIEFLWHFLKFMHL